MSLTTERYNIARSLEAHSQLAEGFFQEVERGDRERAHIVEAIAVAGFHRRRALAVGTDDGDTRMPGGMTVTAAGRPGGAGLADRPMGGEPGADLAGEEQRVGLGRRRDPGHLG